MIEINFIADEIAQENDVKLKKIVSFAYYAAWGVALLVLVLRLQNQQASITQYNDRINTIKSEIAVISPQYQRAVQLYLQRSHHKTKFNEITQNAFETSFIVISLARLANSLPRHFWLKKVQFSTIDSKVFDDNKKKKSSRIKSMTVQGQLFLDLMEENPEQVKAFHEILKKERPFSLAQSRVDMSNLNVGKIGDKYFHNFAIEFAWINSLL